MQRKWENFKQHSPKAWASTCKLSFNSSCEARIRAVHTPMLSFQLVPDQHFLCSDLLICDERIPVRLKSEVRRGGHGEPDRSCWLSLCVSPNCSENMKSKGVLLREELQGQNLLLKPSSDGPMSRRSDLENLSALAPDCFYRFPQALKQMCCTREAITVFFDC